MLWWSKGRLKDPDKKRNDSLFFFALDVDIVEDCENDPIIVSTIINNYLVERILVDEGNAIEVLCTMP